MKPMPKTIWSNIKSKIKQELPKIRQRILENWKSILYPIVLFFGSLGLGFVALLYGFMAGVAKESILKPLVEAEATILGFFALVAVYALTSLDNRLDRLEQQFFDMKEQFGDLTKHQKEYVARRIGEIKRKKRKMINHVLIVGVYLVSSLLLSILALGLIQEQAIVFCFFVMLLFLAGIFGIFLMLYRLSERP